jgi:hypothetical protein
MKRLFVSFDSLRPQRSGFDDRGPVKFFLAKGWTNLVVQNAQNDWYLNDDLEALRDCLAEFARPYRRVVSMAFSMGGYGALLMSRALHIKQVFLVSPQVTPFSAHEPKDRRYRKYEARMREDLGLTRADLNPRLRGYVLFDPLVHKLDRAHARMIAELAPGLQSVAMPMAGHPADKTILEAKLWSEFQGLLTKPDCEAADLKALHRRGRVLSTSYQKALGERITLRAKRNPNGPLTEISLP